MHLISNVNVFNIQFFTPTEDTDSDFVDRKGNKNVLNNLRLF